MTSFYQHKTIWLIGASDGIGAAMAAQLSDYDCQLIISARSEEKLNAIAAEKKKANLKILPLDLSDSSSYTGACHEVLQEFKSVDILINCAGMAHKSFAIDTNEEVDRLVMEVNFMSLVQLTKQMLPSMIARKKGQIVVISSILGEIGLPYVSTYAASKHALNGYFNSLRYELEQHNITVSIVSPGFINTDITKKSLKGDGTVYNENSEAQSKGMDVRKTANKIIRKIAQKKEFSYVGGVEVNMPKVSRLMPRIFQRLMKKLHKL